MLCLPQGLSPTVLQDIGGAALVKASPLHLWSLPSPTVSSASRYSHPALALCPAVVLLVYLVPSCPVAPLAQICAPVALSPLLPSSATSCAASGLESAMWIPTPHPAQCDSTYDFMKSPDPKIIVAADAKKPTETVAARAFSLAESNFWLRNLKIRDYEALFARTIEDTNHPHLFNHDTPLGTAPKSRKRSITSQKATIWPFFAIFSSENTFYLVPRGCGSIKGVPWNHLTISKT